MELAVLCNCEVSLVINSEFGKAIHYQVERTSRSTCLACKGQDQDTVCKGQDQDTVCKGQDQDTACKGQDKACKGQDQDTACKGQDTACEDQEMSTSLCQYVYPDIDGRIAELLHAIRYTDETDVTNCF